MFVWILKIPSTPRPPTLERTVPHWRPSGTSLQEPLQGRCHLERQQTAAWVVGLPGRVARSRPGPVPRLIKQHSNIPSQGVSSLGENKHDADALFLGDGSSKMVTAGPL